MSGHTICLAAAQSVQTWRLTGNTSQSFQLLSSQFFPVNVVAFPILVKIKTLAQKMEIVAELTVFQAREIRLRIREARVHSLSQPVAQYDSIGRRLRLRTIELSGSTMCWTSGHLGSSCKAQWSVRRHRCSWWCNVERGPAVRLIGELLAPKDVVERHILELVFDCCQLVGERRT